MHSLPVQQFQILNPDQTGGIGNAIRTALQTYQDAVKASYADPNAQSDLLAKQLANKMNQPKADYAKQITLADLANTQATTGLTNQESSWYGPKTQAEINSQNASANYTNTQNSWYPKVTESALANQAQQTLEQRILNSFLPQKSQADINLTKAQQGYYSSGGSGGSVDVKNQEAYLRQVGLDNPQLNGDPVKIRNAGNAYKMGMTTSSDGIQLNPLSPITKSFLDIADNSTMNSQRQTQIHSTDLANGLLQKASQLMPQVAKFAGLQGSTNKSFDQVSASLGANNPDYLAYKEFWETIAPQAANAMIQAEGTRVNNVQKQMMLDVLKPEMWKSNPKLALDQWNYLVDTFNDTVKPSVVSGTSQQLKNLSPGSNQQTTPSQGKTRTYDLKTGRFN